MIMYGMKFTRHKIYRLKSLLNLPFECFVGFGTKEGFLFNCKNKKMDRCMVEYNK